MNKRHIKAIVALLLSAACSVSNAQPPGGPAEAPFMVQSDAFEDGGIVPSEFAATVSGGDNVQPGFTFSNVPAAAVSIAIIFHDLDVALNNGTEDVLHWLAWNIPAEAGGIPKGSLPEGSVTGTNLMQQNSYFGPGAPVGPRYHHYVFEFYVLDSILELDGSAGREALLDAMRGKVITKAAYVGRFRGGD